MTFRSAMNTVQCLHPTWLFYAMAEVRSGPGRLKRMLLRCMRRGLFWEAAFWGRGLEVDRCWLQLLWLFRPCLDDFWLLETYDFELSLPLRLWRFRFVLAVSARHSLSKSS